MPQAAIEARPLLFTCFMGSAGAAEAGSGNGGTTSATAADGSAPAPGGASDPASAGGGGGGLGEYDEVPSYAALKAVLDERLAEHNEGNAIMDLVSGGGRGRGRGRGRTLLALSVLLASKAFYC